MVLPKPVHDQLTPLVQRDHELNSDFQARATPESDGLNTPPEQGSHEAPAPSAARSAAETPIRDTSPAHAGPDAAREAPGRTDQTDLGEQSPRSVDRAETPAPPGDRESASQSTPREAPGEQGSDQRSGEQSSPDQPDKAPEAHSDSDQRPDDQRSREQHGEQSSSRQPDEAPSPHPDGDQSPDGQHDHDERSEDQTRDDEESRDDQGPAEVVPGDPDAGDLPEYDVIDMDPQYEGEHLPGNARFGTPVEYLDEVQREDFRLHVDEDGFLRDANDRLFDTSDAGTAQHPNGGRAIFVMDENGRIYASKEHIPGEFHHSSFLSGQPVAAAGELGVKDGKVHLISNQSGHYKPGEEAMGQFMRHLFKREGAHLDLENFDLRLIKGTT